MINDNNGRRRSKDSFLRKGVMITSFDYVLFEIN